MRKYRLKKAYPGSAPVDTIFKYDSKTGFFTHVYGAVTYGLELNTLEQNTPEYFEEVKEIPKQYAVCLVWHSHIRHQRQKVLRIADGKGGFYSVVSTGYTDFDDVTEWDNWEALDLELTPEDLAV